MTDLPPKSPREAVVTAAVVGVLVYLLCDLALGASAAESLLVVLVLTALMALSDIVRGRYRRSSD